MALWLRAEIEEQLREHPAKLDLRWILSEVDPDAARVVKEALRDNTTLTVLWLGHNDLGADGVRHLGGFLQGNNSLTELRLGDTGLGADGVRHLVDFLRGNNTLTELRLGDNGLKADGVRHLEDFLRGNNTLTTLELSFNSIGNEGARLVGEFLQGNNTLTELCLGVNGITQVPEAFGSVVALQVLNLWNNPIMSWPRSLERLWSLTLVHETPHPEWVKQLVARNQRMAPVRPVLLPLVLWSNRQLVRVPVEVWRLVVSHFLL